MSPTPGHTREEDILSLLPLCRFIASIYPGLFDDRYQDACVGAIKAVDRYDNDHGSLASLWTFARHRIRGAVIDGMRTEDHLARSHRARVTARDQWEADHPQQAIPAALGHPDPRLPLLLDLALHDAMFVEDGYARVDTETAVAQGLAALSVSDRKAVTDYYLLGLRNQDMAAALGVTPGRMSMVRVRAEQRMRTAMDRLRKVS